MHIQVALKVLQSKGIILCRIIGLLLVCDSVQAKELRTGEVADFHILSLQLNCRELVCAQSHFVRI